MLVAQNQKIKSLWLADNDNTADSGKPPFSSMAVNINSVIPDWTKHVVYFATNTKISKFDLEKDTQKDLRSFTTPATILEKTGESLYLAQGSQLSVMDTSGQNLYPIFDLKQNINPKAPLWSWLTTDGRRIWVAGNNAINELVLRPGATGLFSGIMNPLS